MRKILLTLAVLIPLWAGARVVQNIDNGWQFLLGDVPLEELDGGTGWRQVDVPHDWTRRCLPSGWNRMVPQNN